MESGSIATYLVIGAAIALVVYGVGVFVRPFLDLLRALKELKASADSLRETMDRHKVQSDDGNNEAKIAELFRARGDVGDKEIAEAVDTLRRIDEARSKGSAQ